jgi:hypothetical protein
VPSILRSIPSWSCLSTQAKRLAHNTDSACPKRSRIMRSYGRRRDRVLQHRLSERDLREHGSAAGGCRMALRPRTTTKTTSGPNEMAETSSSARTSQPALLLQRRCNCENHHWGVLAQMNKVGPTHIQDLSHNRKYRGPRLPAEVELDLAFPVRLCRFSRMFFSFRILLISPYQDILLYRGLH